MRKRQPWRPRSLQMTQFLDTLATTPYQWHLNVAGVLRTDPGNDCLITAVARHLTGQAFSVGQWQAAADAIGLPHDDGELVVSAADNKSDHIPELRARLLAATVNRPAAPEVPAPASDPMDQALAAIIARGVPREPIEEEIVF